MMENPENNHIEVIYSFKDDTPPYVIIEFSELKKKLFAAKTDEERVSVFSEIQQKCGEYFDKSPLLGIPNLKEVAETSLKKEIERLKTMVSILIDENMGKEILGQLVTTENSDEIVDQVLQVIIIKKLSKIQEEKDTRKIADLEKDINAEIMFEDLVKDKNIFNKRKKGEE